MTEEDIALLMKETTEFQSKTTEALALLTTLTAHTHERLDVIDDRFDRLNDKIDRVLEKV